MQGVGGLEVMRVAEEKALVSEAQENSKALVDRRFLEALAERDLDALATSRELPRITPPSPTYATA
jgi:hypothetical protein